MYKKSFCAESSLSLWTLVGIRAESVGGPQFSTANFGPMNSLGIPTRLSLEHVCMRPRLIFSRVIDIKLVRSLCWSDWFRSPKKHPTLSSLASTSNQNYLTSNSPPKINEQDVPV
ncbi:hypothetical protein DPSP01_009733 [Paraphaeosphaeria sporulosa]